MKKFTILTVVAVSAMSFISCSKSSSGYSNLNSVSRPSTRQEPVRVRLISDWQNLSFTSTVINGAQALLGQSTLVNIVSYDMASHKHFAYVKLPGRAGATYKALPANYSTTNGNHIFNFDLDFSTFSVTINNTDVPVRQMNVQDFTGFQFRYIIIPIEVYQSFQINWDDLPSVAAALNFSL